MPNDEGKLRDEQSRGARAATLLESDLLKEAFDNLEAQYLERWRDSKIEDVTGREKLFLAVNVVRKVRGHLQTTAADGKVAAKELDALAQKAERKKILGLV